MSDSGNESENESLHYDDIINDCEDESGNESESDNESEKDNQSINQTTNTSYVELLTKSLNKL